MCNKLKKRVQDGWLGLNEKGFIRPRGRGTMAPQPTAITKFPVVRVSQH